jgi:hypothetical protein
MSQGLAWEPKTPGSRFCRSFGIFLIWLASYACIIHGVYAAGDELEHMELGGWAFGVCFLGPILLAWLCYYLVDTGPSKRPTKLLAIIMPAWALLMHLPQFPGLLAMGGVFVFAMIALPIFFVLIGVGSLFHRK